MPQPAGVGRHRAVAKYLCGQVPRVFALIYRGKCLVPPCVAWSRIENYVGVSCVKCFADRLAVICHENNELSSDEMCGVVLLD